jgi:16S rRNA (guanine527-N7)-methyltransferase
VYSEILNAGAAISALGGQLKHIVPMTIPGLDEQRYLVLIEKIASTPEKYPRRAGVPAKKPL